MSDPKRIYYKINEWDENFETSRSRGIDHKSWGSFPLKQGSGYCRIMSQENGAAIYGAFIAMCSIVHSKPKNTRQGYLTDTGGAAGYPYDAIDIASMVRMDQGTINLAIDKLLETHWLTAYNAPTSENDGIPVVPQDFPTAPQEYPVASQDFPTAPRCPSEPRESPYTGNGTATAAQGITAVSRGPYTEMRREYNIDTEKRAGKYKALFREQCLPFLSDCAKKHRQSPYEDGFKASWMKHGPLILEAMTENDFSSGYGTIADLFNITVERFFEDRSRAMRENGFSAFFFKTDWPKYLPVRDRHVIVVDNIAKNFKSEKDVEVFLEGNPKLKKIRECIYITEVDEGAII